MPELAAAPATPPTRGRKWRRTFRLLGPGIITGAADDDPSGVATYSIAGAQFGTRLLWTVVVTWPLMFAVQMMCARIGMVTGEGLAAVWKRRFPAAALGFICILLLGANTINLAADLAGMADAAEMLTGWNSHSFVVIFGVGVTAATVAFSYRQICTVLKWLVLSLFAYVFAGIAAHPKWREVLHDTLIPSWPKSQAEWSTLVALFGTTISPYLFFWQAAQEVEEKKVRKLGTTQRRRGMSGVAFDHRRLDVGLGTFFSNVVMFFIILSCAETLHRHGITEILSAKEAAAALRPGLGTAATTLYTLGILGVGCVAIPTLAGSAAYAFADTFGWKQGLDEKCPAAPAFYAVLIFSGVLGIALNFIGVNPVKALYWSAVLNGILSPFLLLGILFVASNKTIMNGQTSSRISQFLVAVTIVLMFAGSVALIFV